MVIEKTDYSLYLVTDRSILNGRDLYNCVEESIEAGATALQLREKNTDSRDFYLLALSLKELTGRYNIPLIINDRLDIALAVNADGLHIGQKDLPVEIVRRIFGTGKLLGCSVSNVEEARQAEKAGADYLGAGPVYPTGSKSDAGPAIGPEGLREIISAVNIPVVGIGGIDSTNAREVKNCGAAGVAVISAILGSDKIAAATGQMLAGWRA